MESQQVEKIGKPVKARRIGTAAAAQTEIMEYITMGQHPGVRYVRSVDGLTFGLLFSGTPTEKTKYGTPCWHFGGRGQDRPVYPCGAQLGHVAVNPGTVSIVPSEGAKAARKEEARLDKVFAGLDPETIARYLQSRGASVKVEE